MSRVAEREGLLAASPLVLRYAPDHRRERSGVIPPTYVLEENPRS
jgi:hypothetical protein